MMPPLPSIPSEPVTIPKARASAAEPTSQIEPAKTSDPQVEHVLKVLAEMKERTGFDTANVPPSHPESGPRQELRLKLIDYYEKQDIETTSDASYRRLMDIIEDYSQDFPDVATIVNTIVAASPNEQELDEGIEVRGLTEYMALKPTDDAELIKDRFLCKGGGLLFVAPTGVGKSSWSMQTAISWSLGKSSFGMTPVRKLKSLIIQAENDDYDIREEIDGVLKGLYLSEEDQATANNNVNIAHVNDRTGFEFFDEVLEPTLKAYKPDLLWIDPVLAYLRGDVSDQKDVSRFLRHSLNPILKKYQCACVLVHHTKKQTTNGEDVQDEAYLGMGSSEFSNWCRASLVLRKVKGVNHIFRLSAPKRGTRLHWKKDDKTTPTIDRYVAQSLEPNVIFWNELTQAVAEDAQDTTDTDR